MSVEGKHRDFIVRSQAPLNGGPNADAMRRDFLTPNDQFFVRNHGDVPAIDPASYRLRRRAPPPTARIHARASSPSCAANGAIDVAVRGARRTELMAVEAIPHELLGSWRR